MSELDLPDTTQPRKPRRRTTEPEQVTAEAPQQTLAEYERLAIGTGEWKGTDAPEFSDDGETWSTAWVRLVDEDLPVFCRATVYRKGVRPIVVVIRWDEALPATDPWRALWLRKPVTLFGAFALRAAYRRGFRDVIGDHHAPDEQHTEPTEEATA